MPAYALPGTEVGPRRARAFGLGALLLAVVVLVGWRVLPEDTPADRIQLSLLTTRIGEGVGPGTDVRLNGVRVGSVTGLDTTGPGRQRIGLSLQHSELFGLTDSLAVDYVPGNLFGITALELHAGSGGNALADGTTVDLTGGTADRVHDATLAALLEFSGGLTGDVLTPELAALLTRTSHDFSAFTPLLQALGTTARAFTETQQSPPSMLLDRFGSILTGLPPMLSAGLGVLHAADTNPYFQSPEHIARFKQVFGGIQDQLLPSLIETAGTGQRYFGGFIPIVTAILDRLSASIGSSQQTGPQLSELLDRLRAAFHDTPDGPVLHTEIDLVTPGLAQPLAALLADRPNGGEH